MVNRKNFLDKLSALLKEYEVDEMSAEYIADSAGVPYDAKIVLYSNGNKLAFMRHCNGQEINWLKEEYKEDNGRLLKENAELNKALDKAIKLIVKVVEYNEGTCILGDGDCPVANGLCTSLSDKYKCKQEECWREYFTS